MPNQAVLLAASPGGHLAELKYLVPRLVDADLERIWLVHESAQVNELLAGERLITLPYSAPRDAGAVLRNVSLLRRRLRRADVGAILTSGAGIGLSAILAARTWGRPAHFVELAARSDGPSLTGRIASWIPGVGTLTQYEGWRHRGWQYCGSIFDAFEPSEEVAPLPDRLKVFVTVGLNEYAFSTMLRAVDAAVPAEADIVWQTGTADWSPTRGVSHRTLGSNAIAEHMGWADVVISHAGTGSCLAALDAGKSPILIPRRVGRREHVDDHQMQIARDLSDRGIASVREPDDLVENDLRSAATQRVARRRVERPAVRLKGLS